ncbi:O-antigen ligase family protein [Rhodoferax sp. AJA081-3]|uniref:O-antigen ligase family protein n=1 Tax=Rhodoferax sp. AJA081-3 TaxID=2752316 RepID=UPI001ADF76A2|nr:O-antigen ligase family protein [Rhodoferax sp. AJA081-3]QTN26489.1 O-antigen ligase family protein [Rhodoferax sp. AJA081-3]
MSPAQPSTLPSTNRSVAILACMMLLVPALGVPSELVLQDTLKSTLVAFGVLGAAVCFVLPVRPRDSQLLWHGLIWLPLLLMVHAVGSMAWAHTYLASVEAIRWFLLGLLLWLGLNTSDRDNFPTLAWGIHIGATVASLWAAMQFWLDLTVFPQAYFPASTFINRNFFAEYAVCALPFSVWLLANMRASRWLGLVTLTVGLNVVTLMMTGTRSALTALLITGIVLIVLLLRFRENFEFVRWSARCRYLVAGGLFVSVVVLSTIPSNNLQIDIEQLGTTALQRSFTRISSVTKVKEYTHGTFSTRVAMWKATARMVMANPWTGVGAGSWEVQIPRYERIDATLETDYYAHNEILQLLSEYGLAGGLALATLLAYLLHSAGSTWNLQGTGRQEAPLRGIALTSLLALLIVSCAGFPWHLAGTGALFALCLGVLASSDARLEKFEPFFARTATWRGVDRLPMLFLLVGLLGTTAYIVQQAVQAEFKLVRAIHIANRLSRDTGLDVRERNALKAEMLQSIRQGVAVNPHYRKLTAELAEPLAAGGDWRNAVWILESVVASRPHVAALWTGLAMGYSQLGQHDRANGALKQVQRLKPEALPTRTLEVVLLNRSGHQGQAIMRLNESFDQGVFGYDMVQVGYAIGYQAQNWPLAIRSLELRIAAWPQQAADGYFRLGLIYANPAVHEDAKALAAFKSGLLQVPLEQRENYRQQVPQPFRDRM